MRAGKLYVFSYGACPSYRVFDYFLNIFILERGIGFVTGLEVENFSISAYKRTAASENLTAVEPAHKYKLIWIGNIEGLSVEHGRPADLERLVRVRKVIGAGVVDIESERLLLHHRQLVGEVADKYK